MNTDSLLRSLAMDGMGRRGHTWRGIKKKIPGWFEFCFVLEREFSRKICGLEGFTESKRLYKNR